MGKIVVMGNVPLVCLSSTEYIELLGEKKVQSRAALLPFISEGGEAKSDDDLILTHVIFAPSAANCGAAFSTPRGRFSRLQLDLREILQDLVIRPVL